MRTAFLVERNIKKQLKTSFSKLVSDTEPVVIKIDSFLHLSPIRVGPQKAPKNFYVHEAYFT